MTFYVIYLWILYLFRDTLWTKEVVRFPCSWNIAHLMPFSDCFRTHTQECTDLCTCAHTLNVNPQGNELLHWVAIMLLRKLYKTGWVEDQCDFLDRSFFADLSFTNKICSMMPTYKTNVKKFWFVDFTSCAGYIYQKFWNNCLHTERISDYAI